MTVRNYTTQIAVEKTVMEIEQILVKFGAGGVLKEYAGSHVTALMFFIVKDDRKIPFKLPVDITKSRAIIGKAVDEGKLPKRYLEEPLRTEQGERVVWRIVKDWIDSQLSLMEMSFADSVQIFLPYAYDAVTQKTVGQKFMDNVGSFIAIEDKTEGAGG